MTVFTLTEAKETVRSTIANGLRHGISQLATHVPDKQGALTIANMSQDILDSLLRDPESAQALLALLESSHTRARDGDDWLKTDEAAKRMGFSRPYVAALIDAGELGSGVSKTEKGHRRVKASAVDQWLLNHSVVASKEELTSLRSQAESAEFFENPICSDNEKTKLIKRINKGRNESMKYRPLRKNT